MILLELFLTFLKIGAFTFGGGYAMLPLIQEGGRGARLARQRRLVNFVAVSEIRPARSPSTSRRMWARETAGFSAPFAPRSASCCRRLSSS